MATSDRFGPKVICDVLNVACHEDPKFECKICDTDDCNKDEQQN
jgi:hypothetical protein